jgi:hypothetical protein
VRNLTIRVLIAAFVPVVVLAAGCGREQNATPPPKKAPKERSAFFTQVAGEPEVGALKRRLSARFPDIDVSVGRAGPAGGGGWTQVEVSVKVEKSPRKFSEDVLPLLAELELYFKDLARSQGAEFQGEVKEQAKDGKKEGFSFAYKAQADSGIVRVGPQQFVQGALLLTVSERE